MDRKSIVVLILATMFTIGGWMVALPTWYHAASPGALGGLLMNLAAVAAGALGVNITKKG